MRPEAMRLRNGAMEHAHGAMEWLVGRFTERKSSEWNIAQNNQIHFWKTFLYILFKERKKIINL